MTKLPSDRAFARAWEIYPPRTGSNSRREALQSWNARLREQEDPEIMVVGATRYRQFCESQGKLGTEYVMQGKRFFGPSRHYLESWDSPATPDPLVAAALAAREQQDRDAQWLDEQLAKANP